MKVLVVGIIPVGWGKEKPAELPTHPSESEEAIT